LSELVARGVTFDFGQVLASLDPVYLAEKLASRGVVAEPVALAAAMPAGWEAYGNALRTGGHGGSAWKLLIRTVVELAGAAVSPEVLQFLFDDQRPRNLWRRPVPGMIDLARDLRALGVPVGIVSNSEGALATLVETLGWTSDFPVVADSGVLGFEKPGRAIFDWTATRLAVPVETLVHIGDSWAADVEGALGVGAQAIWFVEGQDEPIVPASVDERRRGRVSVARDTAGVRRALALALGRPIASLPASS
jgi:putative hydrolase of the HAD superfamily